MSRPSAGATSTLSCAVRILWALILLIALMPASTDVSALASRVPRSSPVFFLPLKTQSLSSWLV